MGTAHDYGLSQDVTFHCFEHVRASGVHAQIELRVEREKLEGVMVQRTYSGRARPEVTDSSIVIFCLDCAFCEFGAWRNALGKFVSRARNVKRQPVQNVGAGSVDRFVEIVQD